MTTIRVKDLTLQTPPVGADSIEVDSTSGGTRRVLVSEILAGFTLDTITGFDDFTDALATAWGSDLTAGGTASFEDGIDVAGYGGTGYGKVSATDAAGSRSDIARVYTSFWPAQSPVITWRLAIGFEADDHYDRLLGLAEQGLANIVAWAAVWNGASHDHSLLIMKASAPDFTAFALPALGGAKAYIVRLTMTPTGATLEIAPEGSALAVVATRALAPTATLYSPLVSLKGSGVPAAETRTAAPDYVAWRAARI